MLSIGSQWDAGSVISPRNMKGAKLKTFDIPNVVSPEILEAVKAAVAKIRPFSKRARFNGQYLGIPVRKLQNIPPKETASPPYRAMLRPRLYIETKEQKAKRVKRELLDAGVTFYGLLKAESRFLPKVLHNNEHVEAVVYGQHRSSSVMLAATSERIVFLDKKPMALFLDEVSYEVISGIEFEIHTLFASLTLHTPVKNYDIRLANLHCAANFARHIEAHRLKREEENSSPPQPQPENWQKGILQPIVAKGHELEDMAGYYWLPMPTEEEEDIRRSRTVSGD